MSARAKLTNFAGLLLIFMYCLLATTADAITRSFAQGFEAPQLYFFSGGIVAVLSIGAQFVKGDHVSLISKCPRVLALRSVLYIMACVFYFFAFRSLPFAEVFVFIALVPIFVGLLSGPILGEPVRWQSWLALLAGVGGMFLLYPDGIDTLTWTHLSAVCGALSGAGALVLARLVSRFDDNALLQVLYPNLALCLAMAFVLPFVYREMALSDLRLILLYSLFLFAARWVLVLSLSRMKAYVVTLLINFQFVIMLLVGAYYFNEAVTATLISGVGIIILSGTYLYLDEIFNDHIRCKRPERSVFFKTCRSSPETLFDTGEPIAPQGRLALTLKS